ncbi:hypothetical protein AERO9A_350031 [Aeromonas salmonicida]|nr:hypothetical protein AERO9A_350031 [Aeromonas salmonicida]
MSQKRLKIQNKKNVFYFFKSLICH